MSKRVLFVNSSLSDGGSEKAMVLVAEAMANAGHEVCMLLVRQKPETYLLDLRIRLEQLTYSSEWKIRILISRVQQIRSAIKRIKPDFVISYMWDLNVTTLLASLGLGSRVIVSERAYPDPSARSLSARFAEWITYPIAYRIVYQTVGAQAYCYKLLRERSVVIPNIVDRPSIERAVGRRSKTVVSVGRLKPQKNFPLLLAAFAEFVKHHADWTLEIYGNGPLRTELAQMSQELGISDRVELRGYVPNIDAAIVNAGMFILSSDYEGISNAMTEAMALGLPVICTDCPVGGAALVIKDRVNGLLVPVRDKESLVCAMNDVASDIKFAEELGENARKVSHTFSKARVESLWQEVLDEES